LLQQHRRYERGDELLLVGAFRYEGAGGLGWGESTNYTIRAPHIRQCQHRLQLHAGNQTFQATRYTNFTTFLNSKSKVRPGTGHEDTEGE